MSDVLIVNNLTKKFADFTAVDNISFSIKTGEIVGLLGPNGAGKTTTIQMLLSVLTPTSGEIIYFDKNLNHNREEILEKVNFSTTYTNLPWELNVKENLTFIAYLYDIKDRKSRLKEIIEVFKLNDLQNKRMVELSAGQLTRVNLAKAFINYPKVLLLDEPTASMDPDIATYLRNFILSKKEENNMSIIWTSHDMFEVEEVCDRVIFINNGKIIANDTPEQLAKTIQISHIELLIKDGLKRIISYCEKNKIKYKTEKRIITIDIKEKDIAKFLREIADQNIFYDEISIEKPTLEDYFLEVAKK